MTAAQPGVDTDQLLRDKAAITDVVSLYHHLIDGPEVSRLGEVFSMDAIFDTSAFGLPVAEGLDAIIALFGHDLATPVKAHVGGNALIEVDGDEARCVSKCIGMLSDGRVGVSIHSDRLRRTAEGWRVEERRVTMPPHLKASLERTS
jgi:hypothetical protein